MIIKVKHMKKYFLAFIIPVVILVLSFIFNGVIFGDFSAFVSDSQLQYQQLLIYLKRFFVGSSSFSYTFQVGFGTPLISTFAYYLMSPFNILVNFFSYENIEVCFLLLSFIKIGLCGVTMYSYLKYNYTSKYLLLFAISYALSFYIVINYFNIMWLDAYFLAPLLLLGIDKLIKERKPLLYGIVLFLIILTNYYMGYMCCLYSVLYFVYKYLLMKNKDKRIILNFIIISLLSGLMTMFLHLPNLLELINIPRNISRDYLFNTDISGILSKIFIGSNVSGGLNNEFHPYLYIGVFNIILLLFYFFNQKIERKEKILSLIFLFVLAISIIIVPLNNFWHALSNPIGFNFRYIYLFNIFTISLCVKSFVNLRYVDLKWYLFSFLVIVLIALLVIVRDIMNPIYIYVTLALALIYLCIFKSKNKDTKFLFLLLAISELFFNCYTVLNAHDFTYRKALNGRYQEKTDSVSKIVDDGFYRMEFETHQLLNEPLYYNYNGITGWLSSANLNSDFYNNIGYYSYNNLQLYNHYLLLDSLFGIKYYESIRQYNYYELLETKDVSIYDDMLYGNFMQTSYLYQNPYALGLGYMVDKTVKEPFICSSAFDCQNKMIKQMTAQDNEIYNFEKIDDVIEIKSKDNFYVLFVENSIDVSSAYSVCIDQNCFVFNYNSNKVVYVENDYEIGDTIEVNVGNKGDIKDIYVGYFDFDLFTKTIEDLTKQQLNITDFKSDHIKGNIEVLEDNVLFLSIPYNDNFEILVDGTKTDYYQVFNNFIGLDLNEGYHEIEIIYKVKGLNLGITISLSSFVLFIIYNKKALKLNK